MQTLTPEATEYEDPRKRRTRAALQRGLETLLKKVDFEQISVGDISEAAGLNRATFYAHYADKFALLECMVGCRFNDLLVKRRVSIEAGCSTALEAMTLAVYDYLISTKSARAERNHQLEPHLETAIVGVVTRMMFEGLERHGHRRIGVANELIATAASWAMYGTVRECLRMKKPAKAEALVAIVKKLVVPMFEPEPHAKLGLAAR